jgi:DNA-directed RNA polymerase subunit D
MKIQILKKSDTEVQFLIEEVTSAFANELRRIMSTEVPAMAIEWVDFKKNDSVLNDELLANRLGQIPLTFDKKAYNLPEDCKCEGKGCSRCQTELVLKKKGPGMVYSSDLKSKDKSVVPVFDKIPIVELFENQELQFEAVAQLGRGKVHAKWQAANVGYKNEPNIILSVKNPRDFEKYMKMCPLHLFKIDKDKLIVSDPIECTLCMQCIERGKEDEIKVETVENAFVFNVETVSGLPIEDVIISAAEILEQKANDFGKELKKLK